MKSFGLIVNHIKDTDLQVTRELIDIIHNQNGSVHVLKEMVSFLNHQKPQLQFHKEINALCQNVDILVSLGGDGTFLKTARLSMGRDLPVVGVNLGKLGFLTEIEYDNMAYAVDKIMQDACVIEDRMVLEVSIVNNQKKLLRRDYAFNDAVIMAQNKPKMLHLNTYINDSFVEYIPGDGVIIATPTGSTAYSLSAGGPLVDPDVNLIIITPICPHTLYSRPFITSSERTVSITQEENQTATTVTIDGQNIIHMAPHDTIVIKKADFGIQVLKLNPEKFFDVLRNKIYNRGEKMKK